MTDQSFGDRARARRRPRAHSHPLRHRGPDLLELAAWIGAAVLGILVSLYAVVRFAG